MAHLRPSTGGSAIPTSLSGVRPPTASGRLGVKKVAHTSLQHARFHAPPPDVRTEGLEDPFSVYAGKLAALEELAAGEKIASHHLVIDCVRILEDILIHAAQTFLEHRTPPILLSLTVEYAQTGVAERLRDAEVITPWTNRQIEEARKLAKWVLVSSAREVPWETSHNLLILVSKLTASFIADVASAAAATPHSGCASKHAFCRDMMPSHLDVVGGPHNAHTVPATRPGTSAALNPADASGLASPTNVGGLASPTSNGAPPQGGLANPDIKGKRPKPRAHDALPYGWTRAEFEAHCAPLHNTTHLDLAQLEEEEEEAEREATAALEAERQEKIRLREEAAQRRRDRRAAEEARRNAGKDGVEGDLSDLDENPDEVDSEDERLTARRREARAAAADGAPAAADNDKPLTPRMTASEEEDNEEPDSDEDDEAREAREARKAAREERRREEAEDEKVANEPIPALAVKPQRFAFTFCCIVCHSVVLRAKDIDRIVNNQVWTKTGKALSKSLLKNPSDSWFSRPADEKDPSLGQAEDEEDEEAAQQEEEEEEGGPEAPPKDEGAAKREESIGVHCSGCDYYLGRHFPARDAYRLIYIQRSSGQNFLYHTGSTSTDRLRPAMVRLTEEEEEAQAEQRAREEEQGEDEEEEAYQERRKAQEEARKSAPIPPIIGVPSEYTDVRQATVYPYPRFGSSRPYGREAAWQRWHKGVMQEEETGNGKKDAEESKTNDNSLSSSSGKLSLTGLLTRSTSSSSAAGSKASTKANSKTYRPVIPPLPLVHTMLRRQPDSHYALPPQEDASTSAENGAEKKLVVSSKDSGRAVTADLSVLLWTDRVFHNRRALDAVTTRIVQLFTHFPSGVYANTTNPPVPLFTYFFVPNEPDFTHVRGTARYIFHYLTKKDDSKVKRQQYTHKKFVKSLSKNENSVYHMTAGGYGGHRFVLVKVGAAYRIFQSNNCLESAKDRYTCLQWIASDYPWSRILDQGELLAFLAKFEEARRGRRAIWEELFTCGQRAQGLYDVSDTWQPDQVYFALAKLQDFAIEIPGTKPAAAK